MTSTRARTATFAAALAAAVGACGKPPSNALTKCEQVFGGEMKTDILFVIDDSNSMAQNQQKVQAALSQFVATLVSSPIHDDFQIGVTNTSISDFGPTGYTWYTTGPNSVPNVSVAVPYPDGSLIAVDPTNLDPSNAATYGKYFWTSSASAPGPGFYGPRNQTWQYMRAADPTLVTDFSNNVFVGTYGSIREQPFDAMKHALSTRLANENAGFIRPGARLAIIFVSDEDDCSGSQSGLIDDTTCRAQRTANPSLLKPVSDYVSFLNGPIGGEYKDVIVAAIVGVTCSGGTCTDTPCPSAATGTDPPATRYIDLLSSFPTTSTVLASVCDSSFYTALDQFAGRVMSQSLPLQGDVADFHLLVVTVTKATGQVISCPVAQVGTAAASTAGAVYTPSSGSTPAKLTFGGACLLDPGDKIDVKVICAG